MKPKERILWISLCLIMICSLGVWGILSRIDRTSEKVTFTVGQAVNAYGITPDFAGITDAAVQSALNALPVTGGEIDLISPVYTFSSTVSRAINNVTIKGMNGTTINYDARTPVFSAGSQTGWKFEDLITDAGGIATGTDTMLIHVKQGSGDIDNITTSTLNANSVTVNGKITQNIPNIIEDTDIGGDLDDVLALTLTNVLVDDGECNLLGVEYTYHDNYPDAGAAAIQSVEDYFGRNNIPIGANHLSRRRGDSVYTYYMASNWPNTLSNSQNAQSAVTSYRKILAHQPNGSVTLLTHGPLTNIYNLYNSPADNISPLTGSQLMLAKIRTWVCMGGDYPTGSESNFKSDKKAAGVINRLAHTSIKIYFAGYTLGQNTKVDITNLSTTSPTYAAFLRHHEYIGYYSSKTWNSFDLTAALFAIRGSSYGGNTYFKVSAPGINTIDPRTGKNSFNTASGGNMYYLTNAISYAELGATLSNIMCTPPKYVNSDTWWDKSYGYRKKITIDATSISTNLKNFSLLVKLDSENFDFTKSQSNGQDVRFVSQDGLTPLNYEIDTWDSGGRTAAIWVRVPSIKGGNNTQYIYMYYGNSHAKDGQSVNYAFDDNTVFVSHMNDYRNTSHIYDSGISKQFVVAGTKTGAADPAITANGYVGNGQVFDGSTSRINIAATSNKLSLTNMTLNAAFFIPTSIPTGFHSLMEHNYNSTDWYGLFTNGNSVTFRVDNHGDAWNSDTSVLSPNTWYLLTGTYDTTTKAYSIYLNGISIKSGIATNIPTAATGILTIGARSGSSSQYFRGTIDEIRLSNIARSADWIKFDYYTMTHGILSFGPVENNPYRNGF